MHINSILENIEKLIEFGSLAEADKMVEHYGLIFGKTKDFYSFKSIINILRGDLIQAESIILDCIDRYMIDEDIIYNLIYILNQKKDVYKANEFIVFQNLLGYNLDVQLDYKLKIEDRVKVLHGTIEIANQMNTQVKALSAQGVSATSINYYENYMNFKSDISLNLKKFSTIENADIAIKRLSSSLILDYDIFHFHFGTTLTLDGSDLPIIKDLNKKTIMQYWGSDVRQWSIAKKINPYTKVKQVNENIIKKNLEFHSKYISDCFVDYELYEYVKDYYKNIHITRSSIDLERFKCVDSKVKIKDKLLIVHAPTSPEFKGTGYIVDALESLRYRGDFEFKLVTGVSNEDAVEIYKEADIIIDQLHFGTYGLFAVESMALGKPVISWISDFMREKLPKELPIIIANPDTIKSVLKNLLDNKDELCEIGRKSRLYVEKYHDSKKVAQEHLEIYKSL